jgi:hypothetical protein
MQSRQTQRRPRLGGKPQPFANLTRSESFKVVPKESARHKKQPHFPSKSFVVVPTVVDHPVWTYAQKEKVAKRNPAGYGIVL